MCVQARATAGLDVVGDVPERYWGGQWCGHRSEMAVLGALLGSLGWSWDCLSEIVTPCLGLVARTPVSGTHLPVACRPRCQGCSALEPQVTPSNPRSYREYSNHIIS